MSEDDVLFRFRLRCFTLAEELGSAAAACRQMGIGPLDLLPLEGQGRPLRAQGPAGSDSAGARGCRTSSAPTSSNG